MDGVLIDYRSSWKWIHDYLGIDNSEDVSAFMDGRIDDLEFMRRDIARWKKKNIGISDIKEIFKKVPVMNGLKETFYALKNENIKTCVISGGLDFMVDILKEDVSIDFVRANSLCLDNNGNLEGEGVLRVPILGKKDVLRELRDELGIEKEEVVAIGDLSIDIKMFEEAGLKIAFNPCDEIIKKHADVVIENKDLRLILPYIIKSIQNTKKY